MIKDILVVTITVLNLGPVETAWEEHLGYSTVAEGTVSAELSDVWNTPEMTGKDYVLMQPSSEAEVYIRFVEDVRPDDYVSLTTHGWNATELLVTDPDGIAAAMEDSPFTVVGPPADLWDAPDAPRAMQAIGPGDEFLYFTRNNDFVTDTDIDRVFIMVLGGPSLDALSDYYEQTLGLGLSDPLQLPVPFMAAAQCVPADHLYSLRVAILSPEFLFELDEYPATTTPRPVKPGHLPPGTAMVGVTTTDLDALDVSWRATPAVIEAFPYNGRRVGVTQGPAGEWLEIIETRVSE
ncbi:MAG: hypothetical protein HKN56_04595 [Gammaproteobacteria bacterium]|nr:hypothetical protein [Gammaproteobacteria bacterium]NND54234.1 hypothetical protein [Gammaproteobacteria bacterium]